MQKFRNWYSGLSKAGKVAFIGASIFSFFAVVNATAQPSSQPPEVKSQVQTVQSAEPTPPQVKKSVTEKSKVSETAAIPFEKTTINDSSLEKGKTSHLTVGVNGVRTTTYEITTVDGTQTDKKLLSDVVTTQPITDVVAIGTKIAVVVPAPAPTPPPVTNCNTNYSGACVPNASDVDCAGGSGNGPAYAAGPFRVVGTDIYDLDRDGNGIACE